jgi:DNA-binding transcriptional ArsR family regulator
VIRIELDEPTLSRTRIAISPLWEAVCSLFLLARNPGEVPWPYGRWAERARRVLDTVPAAAPVRIFGQHLIRIWPDFFAPIPPTPQPSLDEELAALEAAPAALITEQLATHYPDGVPAALVPFQRDPAAALRRHADGLAAYWSAAIAPHWPAMRAALDEEVLHRASALAADGPDALLSGLHERVRWERPVLTLVKPHEQSFTATDKRLLLIPLIFSRGALMCSTDDPDVLGVSYQSRGAAALAEGARPEPASRSQAGPVADARDRLIILVGRGRASVLRELSVPATTATLATRLGLAPSTVSEHLAALSSAGVVNRRRIGRRVLYGLEPTGLALLTLLDPPGNTRATG